MFTFDIYELYFYYIACFQVKIRVFSGKQVGEIFLDSACI